MNKLSVKKISKSYNSSQVVSNVSIEVNTGEIIGLLGPNGAGKTTCFYMMMGLIAVDAGRVEIDGEDVTMLPMYQRARLGVGLALVPEGDARALRERVLAVGVPVALLVSRHFGLRVGTHVENIRTLGADAAVRDCRGSRGRRRDAAS